MIYPIAYIKTESQIQEFDLSIYDTPNAAAKFAGRVFGDGVAFKVIIPSRGIVSHGVGKWSTSEQKALMDSVDKLCAELLK